MKHGVRARRSISGNAAEGGEFEVRGSVARSSRRALLFVDIKEVDPARIAWLDAYTPAVVEPGVWALIGGFVREQVVRLDVDDETIKRLARVLARLTAWAFRAGFPLDIEQVLDPATVESFVSAVASGESTMTVAVWRSDLRRLGPALTTTAPWERAPVPLTPQSGATPYTHREVCLIRGGVAAAAPTRRAHLARVAVTLGLGVGLDGRWVGNVRGSDVVEVVDGLAVAVPAPHSRLVAVRTDFAEDLAALAADAGSDPLVGAGVGKNRVTQALAATEIDQGRIVIATRRLRATWLLALINRGVHLGVIVEAAGLGSPDALAAVLRHADPVDPEDAAKQVRSS